MCDFLVEIEMKATVEIKANDIHRKVCRYHAKRETFNPFGVNRHFHCPYR